MDVRGKTVLVLGAWGLVGSAICRELLRLAPRKLVVSSLRKNEADEAAANYRREFPGKVTEVIPVWGSIFVRQEWKDLSPQELAADPVRREQLLRDQVEGLSEKVLESNFLFQLIQEHRPDIIVDAINSATVFAYQDMYSQALKTMDSLKAFQDGTLEFDDLSLEVERSLTVGAIPQLIRHTQILHKAMTRFGTSFYGKIGTSGTGGMGLNIPYTHSEERPSRMLLTKSAIAGAHTLLLFLMARTPGGPIIKEFKPTAAIAWKRIGYGPVMRRGKPIQLHEIGLEDAIELDQVFSFQAPQELQDRWAEEEPRVLEEVHIDTGENGSFSRSEFEAITTIGQMEFITPEEIAQQVVYEVQGGNTGKDVLDGLDMACMGPTYRAGALRESALSAMRTLEEENQSHSVAFENLGPPRLSKLLYEAHLLKRAVSSLKGIDAAKAEDLAEAVAKILEIDSDLRSRILSIGIGILLPDGKSLLRGPELHVPAAPGKVSLAIEEGSIDAWADAGWIDLRVRNFERWKDRARVALEELDTIPETDTSSRYHRGRSWWHSAEDLDEGKLVGWLFIDEDKGLRMKR